LYNSNEGKSEAISITLILHEMPVNRVMEKKHKNITISCSSNPGGACA